MAQNWRNYTAYYVIPYIGRRDVQEIDGTVCDALYAKLLTEGRSRRGRRSGQLRGLCTRGGPARRAGAAVPTIQL
jgi:hypothetical protein